MASQGEEVKTLNLDKIIVELGSLGRYQIMSYIIIMFPIAMSAICKMQYVFVAGDMGYRCRVPECESPPLKYKAGSWSSFALLPEDRCHRYKPNGSTCTKESFTNQLIPCKSWVYENNNTVVHTYDLACNELRRTSIGCVSGFGLLLGVFVCSYISDRFGRKVALIETATINGIFSLVRSYSTNYDTHMVLEFLNTFLGSGVYSSGFIICLEMVQIKHRVVSGSVLSCSYAIGQAVLAGTAYLVRYWRHLLRCIAAPGFCFILYYFIINESVRWLLMKGKNEKAVHIIKKVARINKVTFSPETQTMLNEFEHYHASGPPPRIVNPAESFKMIRKSRILLIRMIVCAFWWAAVTFIFYGLSINSVSLVGSKYLNYLLMALVEFPGYFLTIPCFNKIGRKKSMMGAFMMCGLLLIPMAVIPSSHWITVVLTTVSKMLIAMAYNGAYIYTVELFPTRVRHRTLGACSMLGRIGSALAPLTPGLILIWPPLPFTLFGIFSFLASTLGFLVPETLNKKLPETFYEAEHLATAPVIRH